MIMKTKHLIFALCTATVLTSCLLESNNQYAPTIACGNIINNHGDTLKLRTDDKNDYYWLDTMHVGDTAQFVFFFTGYENDLVSTEIGTDAYYTKLDMLLVNEIRDIMLETSDTTRGLLNFKPGYNAVQFASHYIALKEGTPSMFVSVHTDSKFSPTEFEIRTPIVQ